MNRPQSTRVIQVVTTESESFFNEKEYNDLIIKYGKRPFNTDYDDAGNGQSFQGVAYFEVYKYVKDE